MVVNESLDAADSGAPDPDAPNFDALDFDALVVGAGAGGLCAAARLAHLGYRTLVVERLDRVGGRASTHEVDGFLINNGAIVLELGGVTEQTFDEVGAVYDVRQPKPPLLYRLGGKDVDVTTGGWGFLLSKLTRHGARLVQGIGAARHDSGLPDDELTTRDWIAGYTKNESVQAVFHNMCASIFAVGSDVLPARVFLTYFTRKSAFKRFGFCPDGTIGVWRSLADSITARGGQVWLDSEVTSIEVTGGQVTGARIRRGGESGGEGGGEGGAAVRVGCSLAVSDIGPLATTGLVGPGELPDSYRQQVIDGSKPCALISVNFASRERLIDAPGMLSFGKTRRLCYAANFTDLCPEMAPEGWHLYVGTGLPQPAIGDFDETAETELLLADLREQIPGFDGARILSTVVTRDQWPPQRAVSGFDLPPATPIPNLWNVGDGVKEYANGGTTACAETAQLVVDEIAARYPVASLRSGGPGVSEVPARWKALA